MTRAFDGRVTAAIRKGTPIKFAWEGAWLTYSYAAILRGGPNTADAKKLFAFLNRAQIAAGFTQGIGDPGPNTHQLQYLLAEWVPLLSIDPKNASKVIPKDSAWLAAKRPDGKTNADHLQERWLARRAEYLCTGGGLAKDRAASDLSRHIGAPHAREHPHHLRVARDPCAGHHWPSRRTARFSVPQTPFPREPPLQESATRRALRSATPQTRVASCHS